MTVIDDVHKDPPPALLKSSIENLRQVIVGKLLSLKCEQNFSEFS
jgi:hypothetical protein